MHRGPRHVDIRLTITRSTSAVRSGRPRPVFISERGCQSGHFFRLVARAGSPVGL